MQTRTRFGGIVITAACAFAATSASALQVDYITPGTSGVSILCNNTAAFLGATACVGMVTDPVNDAGGNTLTSTLVTYLNGGDITIGQGQTAVTSSGYIGTTDGSNAWGTQGSWLGIPAEIDSASMPGSSGPLSVSKNSGSEQAGSFTFDSTSLNKYIDQFVINVKGSSGWSSYYYDLSGQDLTTLTNTWDTLGLLTAGNDNNPGSTPGISHIYGAYILGDDVPDEPPPTPDPIPVPGTLLLLGAGLLGLRFRRKV